MTKLIEKRLAIYEKSKNIIKTHTFIFINVFMLLFRIAIQNSLCLRQPTIFTVHFIKKKLLFNIKITSFLSLRKLQE